MVSDRGCCGSSSALGHTHSQSRRGARFPFLPDVSTTSPTYQSMPLISATPVFAWKAGASLGQSSARVPFPGRNPHLGQVATLLATHQLTITPAGITVATGIGAGAFGAHALAPRLGEKAPTWAMAAQYACFNGVALLAISQHPIYSRRYAPHSTRSKWRVIGYSYCMADLYPAVCHCRSAGPLIAVGVTMFSGSIFVRCPHYALCLIGKSLTNHASRTQALLLFREK